MASRPSRSLALLLALALLALPGCVYTNVINPLDTDVEETTLGDKIGRSDAYSVLWLVAWGDRGTKAAAENGNITVIRHMDIQTFSVLFGLYSHVTTIVYGE